MSVTERERWAVQQAAGQQRCCHHSAPPTVALRERGTGMSDLYVAPPQFQMLETSLGF